MLLNKKTVAHILAVHPNTIDNLRRDDPSFPRPLKIADRTLRWRNTDIERWLDSLQADENAQMVTRAKGATERLGL